MNLLEYFRYWRQRRAWEKAERDYWRKPAYGSLTLFRDGEEVAHDCVGPCERCGTTDQKEKETPQ